MLATPGLVRSPLPRITRPDAGHVRFGRWEVDGGPERLRAVMDATAEAWERHPLPAGFLSRTVFAGTDGRTVLDHAQWTTPAAHDAFAADPAGGPLLDRRIAAAAPEAAAAAPPGPYRLYRSLLPRGAAPEPGCIVAVVFDTDGPATARRFVDTLVDRFGGEQAGEGGIASHFHLHRDGTRIVNYSEWTTPEAHRRMAETRLREDDEVPRLIRSLPGLRPRGFERFLPHRGLGRPVEPEHL